MEGENQFNAERQTEYLPPENEYRIIDAPGSISADTRSTKEKVTVVLVLVVSFFAVILGVTQFSSSLRRPFTDLMLLISEGDNSSSEALAILEAQQKDTDGDGLSDYDELNAYATSPYLSDSDSDGISDKAEIEAGHDPNCPGSDSCFRTDIAKSAQELSQTNQQTILSAQSDPKVLRELLIQNGFPKEQLDAITDEQLLITYQQALSGQSPTASYSNANLNTSINSLDDLKNLSGAQIRALMIEQGAPADVLSQVSDDELKAMFLSKLNSTSN